MENRETCQDSTNNWNVSNALLSFFDDERLIWASLLPFFVLTGELDWKRPLCPHQPLPFGFT